MSNETPLYEIHSVLLLSALVFTFATIPIYAFVVCIILLERFHCRFERTFYTIVKIGGFSDIIALCGNALYILTILNWIQIPHTRRYAQILNGLAWASRASTNITDFLISFHRVIAVILPLKHHALFTNCSLRLILILLIVLTIAAFISGTLMESQWVSGAGSGRYIEFRDIFEHQISTLLMQFIVSSAILVNYVILIATYRREMKKLNTTTSSAKIMELHQTQMVLTKVAISVCTLEILFFLYSSIALSTVFPLDTKICIFVFLNGVIIGIPPYLLLYFSSKLRRSIVMRFRRLNPIRIDVISKPNFGLSEEDVKQ